MTLADRLTVERPRLHTRCRLGVHLDQLLAAKNEEHEALIAALEYRTHKHWSADALAVELEREGVTVSASTIRKHRTGVCICDRSHHEPR